MSTKNWKNGELKSLLSEAWGFKMDLSKLNESKEETLKEMDMQTMYNYCVQDCKKADDKKDCINKCMEQGGPSGAPTMEEGCGDHADDGGMEMMVVDDEMDPESQMGGESDVEGLAHELLSLASRIGDALGVDSEVSSMGDDDEEDLEEDRSRGRDAPNVRGKEGKHNLRPEGKKISEAQVRRIVAKVLKERRKKGK